MPRLNTLIEIGFCSVYGDGDYRVSTSISELDQNRFNELLNAISWATKCAQDMWLRKQQERNAAQANAARNRDE